MSKNSIKVSLLLGSAFLSIGVVSGMNVSANTINASTPQVSRMSQIQTNSNKNSELTTEETNEIDKYVSVKNNQYVLQLPKNNNISQEEITEVENKLKQVNNDVKSNGYTINVNDKTYETSTSPVYGNASVKASAPTIKKFWWGIRVYMPNKTAVNKEISEFKNGQAIANFGSLVSPPVGVSLSVYFGSISDHLTNMRDAHPNSKLYMDINRFGVYTIKTY